MADIPNPDQDKIDAAKASHAATIAQRRELMEAAREAEAAAREAG